MDIRNTFTKHCQVAMHVGDAVSILQTPCLTVDLVNQATLELCWGFRIGQPQTSCSTKNPGELSRVDTVYCVYAAPNGVAHLFRFEVKYGCAVIWRPDKLISSTGPI